MLGLFQDFGPEVRQNIMVVGTCNRGVCSPHGSQEETGVWGGRRTRGKIPLKGLQPVTSLYNKNEERNWEGGLETWLNSESSDAPAEDPGLVLARTWKLITVCNSTSRGFNALFRPL